MIAARATYFTLISFAAIMTTSTNAQHLPAPVADCLSQSQVAENNMLSGPDGCRSTLMAFMRDNWRSVLEDFESIAPSDDKKTVLVRAAEASSSAEYLEFLTKVRDLHVTGKIGFQVLQDALMPSRYKEGFLPLNYQHPAVRAFVESVKSLVPQGHPLASYPDDILSGKASTWVTEQFRTEDRRIDGSLLLDRSAAGSDANRPTAESAKTQLPPANASANVAATSPSPALDTASGPEHQSVRWGWLGAGIVGIVALVGWLARRRG